MLGIGALPTLPVIAADGAPAVAETYLRELRDTLETDPKHALLAKTIDPVVLRRDGAHLVAEVQSNIQALINPDGAKMEDIVGAGRAFRAPNDNEDTLRVEPGRLIVA